MSRIDTTLSKVEPEEDEDGDNQVVHDDETAERLERIEQNQSVMQILSDPEIKAVIEAKRAGKKVTVTSEEDAEPDPEPLDLGVSDLEDDDPAKDMVTKLADQVGAVLDKRLSPLGTRLEALENLAAILQQEKISDQVAKAKETHKDLDKYRPEMVQLLEELKKTGNLPIEELYLLAKNRKGDLNVEDPSTFSERPSNQPSRGPRKKRGAERVGSGRASWNDAMAKALDTVDLTPQE